ncbi:hypothetical protein BKA03_002156 [Demequina lutea]|uniref:Uncharacterized protein n=1 Tax=Demequina lutea TaxID=431489 RepID=A0A7Y9ZAX4_9MICO|nr:hypothetical protein [Demequina lutea]
MLSIACVPDHPRSRGDGRLRHAVHCMCSGSPPLARGRPSASCCPLHVFRITPARAGTASRRGRRDRCGWDHPRSRGDGRLRHAVHCMCSGSPPLARGRPSASCCPLHVFRITPARAGTAVCVMLSIACVPDHPRSRGDGVKARPSRPVRLGSPPLARGRRRRQGASAVPVGITPARAGTALATSPRRRMARDHPRSRGDGWCKAWLYDCLMGSPPLARGRRFQTRQGGGAGGITPARAGTATPVQSLRTWPSDHPRSRGDGATKWSVGDTLVGSPPLARGRHFLTCVDPTQ